MLNERKSMSNPKRPFADDDFINPFEWYQGKFIDGPMYGHMPREWKDENIQREKTIVRDARSKNGVFQVTNSEDDAAVVEAIVKLIEYARSLETALRAKV